MAKLNDTQALLLTTAAARADGSLLPPPDEIAGSSLKLRRAAAALLRDKLICEVEGADGDRVWREEAGQRFGIAITDAGCAAVGSPPVRQGSSALAVPAPAATTKKAQVLALLRRGEGATLAELVAATGWLPHTTRAALTGLRKTGHAITRGERDGVSRYTLPAA